MDGSKDRKTKDSLQEWQRADVLIPTFFCKDLNLDRSANLLYTLCCSHWLSKRVQKMQRGLNSMSTQSSGSSISTKKTWQETQENWNWETGNCKAAVRTCLGSGNQPQRRSKGVKTPIRKARILLSNHCWIPAIVSCSSLYRKLCILPEELRISATHHSRTPETHPQTTSFCKTAKLLAVQFHIPRLHVHTSPLPQLRISFTNTQKNKQRKKKKQCRYLRVKEAV